MRILIIEDEELGIDRLKKHLGNIDTGIEVVGTADSVRSSVQWLTANPPPDLILMDIDLGDGQSFDIFFEVPVVSPVIFTTSYDEKALEAFKTNQIEYLLKPVKKQELKASIEKYSLLNSDAGFTGIKTSIDNLVKELQHQLHPKEFRQRFLVRQGKKLSSVEIHEVCYFYCDGRLTYLKTNDNRKFMLDYTLNDLEHMLNPQQYFRISNTHMVAASSILQVHDHGNGRLRLDLLPAHDKDAIVSREKVREFRVWMGK